VQDEIWEEQQNKLDEHEERITELESEVEDHEERITDNIEDIQSNDLDIAQLKPIITLDKQ
jgi:uncharacterized protein (UPF0335 family)